MPALKKEEKALAEASYAAEIIKTYPKINNSSPASWIAYSSDFQYSKKSLLYMCHAQVGYAEAKRYDTMLTAFYAVTEREFAWFDFLKNRLFRDYADRLELVDSGIPIKAADIPDKDLYEKNKGYMFPHKDAAYEGKTWHYIKITKLDTIPANVVYDFCIATRVIIEYKVQFTNWNTLVAAGCDPGLAYRLCYSISKGNDYLGRGGDAPDEFLKDPLGFKITALQAGHGHWAYDLDAGFDSIILGKMVADKVSPLSYKEHPGSSRPCNVLWGNVARDVQKYEGKTVKQLMDEFQPVINQALTEKRELVYVNKVPDAVPPKAEKPKAAGLAAAMDAVAAMGAQPGVFQPAPGWGAPPPAGPADRLWRAALADQMAAQAQVPAHQLIIDDDDDVDDDFDDFEDLDGPDFDDDDRLIGEDDQF